MLRAQHHLFYIFYIYIFYIYIFDIFDIWYLIYPGRRWSFPYSYPLPLLRNRVDKKVCTKIRTKKSAQKLEQKSFHKN